MRFVTIGIFFLIFLLSAISGNCQNNKIDSLEEKILRLKQEPSSFKRDTTTINLLYELAWQVVNYTSDYVKAMNYGREALQLSEKINWKKGKASSYDIIGRIYDRMKNYTAAIQNYSETAKLMDEMGNVNGVATSFYNIGTAHHSKGNLPEALDYFLQALRKNEQTENVSDVGRDCISVGDIYAEIDDPGNTMNYYSRGLKSFEETHNKYWTAIALGNIAAFYNQQHEFNKSLDYYFRVLKMEGDNIYSNYETFYQIGDVYKNIFLHSNSDSAFIKATDYFLRAHQIARQLEDSYIAGLALNGQGALSLQKRKWSEAGNYLHKAEKLLKENNSSEPLGDCYLNLSRLDSVTGNWKSSFNYFQLYTKINDSLFSKKKSRQIAQMEINYATENKQRQIQLLNKNNELKDLRIQQQQKNILLIVAVTIILLLVVTGVIYYRNRKMKQQSLRQISEAKLASLKSLMDKHFIFSSLHSIDNFLMNHNAEAASDYLVKYSKLIRTILEMSNQPEVSLEEEVSLCRSYLELEKIRYNQSFDYQVSIDHDISATQTLFPSMLLQPLVENAVKHGVGSLVEQRTTKGMIDISITRKNDRLVCTVTDNGRGLKSELNKSSTHRSYSGKGITERVKVYNNLAKNRASFNLQDNNPGVTATLTLPFIFKKQVAI